MTELERALLAAKQAYRENPNKDTKAAKQAAAARLREARRRSRPAGLGIGGDAVPTPKGRR